MRCKMAVHLIFAPKELPTKPLIWSEFETSRGGRQAWLFSRPYSCDFEKNKQKKIGEDYYPRQPPVLSRLERAWSRDCLIQSFSGENLNMASRARTLVHKLHAVTLIKSAIGQPWWEKRTVKFLGLNKLHKTVILKNTDTINGQLQAIKHLIDVKPVEIVEEDTDKTSGEDGVFLRENGQFHLSTFQDYMKNNPRMEKVLQRRRKQVVWERKRRR